MKIICIANRRRLIKAALLSLMCCIPGIFAQQEFLPSPPADHSLIYTLDEQNKLVALPFEIASTPLRVPF